MSLHKPNSIQVYVDAGCDPAVYGDIVVAAMVMRGDEILEEPIAEHFRKGHQFLADYKAIGYGLKLAIKHTRTEIVQIFSDSQIAINVVSGASRIQDARLIPEVKDLYSLETFFKEGPGVEYVWRPESDKHIKMVDAACRAKIHELGAKQERKSRSTVHSEVEADGQDLDDLPF